MDYSALFLTLTQSQRNPSSCYRSGKVLRRVLTWVFLKVEILWALHEYSLGKKAHRRPMRWPRVGSSVHERGFASTKPLAPTQLRGDDAPLRSHPIKAFRSANEKAISKGRVRRVPVFGALPMGEILAPRGDLVSRYA